MQVAVNVQTILTLDVLFALQEDILVLANASLVHQDNILMELLVQVKILKRIY